MVARALGVRVTKATIIPDDNTDGVVHIDGPVTDELTAVIHLGGPEASDIRFKQESAYYGGGSAVDEEAARHIDPDGFQANQLRARAIVQEHGSAIDRIADGLLARGELLSPEIDELFGAR